MEKEYSVTELYREIGRTFRELGADKVVLLKARNNKKDGQAICIGKSKKDLVSDGNYGETSEGTPGVETGRSVYDMSLEIAVDGWFEKEKLQQACEKLWPEIEIKLLDLNEDENLGLADEIMEDGILL